MLVKVLKNTGPVPKGTIGVSVGGDCIGGYFDERYGDCDVYVEEVDFGPPYGRHWYYDHEVQSVKLPEVPEHLRQIVQEQNQ